MSDIPGSEARKTFHWEDGFKGENVMYRVPRNIRYNDNVVVKEDEYAVFFRDGKAMHVFDRPGRFALTTENIPVLATIMAKLTGVKQLGEVYYLQRREMRGKFGTTEPLTFRDADFGVVRIRMFGQFAYKVIDPLVFITQFVGTEGLTESAKVMDWLRGEIVQVMNDVLGELKSKKQMAVIDMPAYLQEIEQAFLARVEPEISRYGMKITNLAGLNINLPQEVQEAIDKRGAMGALGVNYMQYQTGKAIEGVGEGAAKGGAGGAGAFAGMGAGFGAGAGMAGAMTAGMADSTAPPPVAKASPCPKCGKPVLEGAKFCPDCGEKILAPGMVPCPKCGQPVQDGVKFCPECGQKMTASCPKCGKDVAAGTKFCPECGQAIS